MGRPRVEVRRDRLLRFVVTEHEEQLVRDAAAQAGTSMSHIIRLGLRLVTAERRIAALPEREP